MHIQDWDNWIAAAGLDWGKRREQSRKKHVNANNYRWEETHLQKVKIHSFAGQAKCPKGNLIPKDLMP